MLRTRLAAQVLIKTAIDLRAGHPGAPALSILDAVFLRATPQVRRSVTQPRCDKAWLRPPGAFPELIRQAFAPELPRADVDLLDLENHAAWDCALVLLVARYK